MKVQGMVYLVGAGPGDAGLLTLRGAELLGRADVVVYDALVNRELLKLAPKTAEKIFGGKRSRDHAIPQEDLNQLLIDKAREGKCVVRLKGGDPYVFGRGGEEAEELAAAGIPFEVVPGITSAIAALNYAGIPVTHREYCSSFTVITGHDDPEKDGRGVDWAQVANLPGTKVILMGVENIRHITQSLLANGAPAETPVAMVRWGTTGDQQSIEGTLSTIADVVEKSGFKAPAVVAIGGVARLRGTLNWFERRPLFGQRIVVTRTREQASQLSSRLRERGAEILEIPTIKIVPPTEQREIADVLLELNSYDWVIFTSPNGVTMFFEYFFKAFEDMRDIGGVRIAAVGPATAAKLKELHLKVDVMPEKYVAEKVADALLAYESIENLRILLLRAEVATRELPKKLEESGAIVDDVACYKTIPETEDLTGAAGDFQERGADWITFTSASTVENFNARFALSEVKTKFPAVQFVSIGPETSKALEALGLKADLEAKPHTIEGLAETLEKAVVKAKKSA
jgi:uroporphyrinogen III methyltransferase/synthase